MTEQELKLITDLQKEVETLKSLFYQNNYSDLQVFTKKVQFKSDVNLGSSIGISKDKLGFYGVSTVPIVQPTTSVGSATFSAGVGTAVKEDSTFDGYTISKVVKALRNLGIIL